MGKNKPFCACSLALVSSQLDLGFNHWQLWIQFKGCHETSCFPNISKPLCALGTRVPSFLEVEAKMYRSSIGKGLQVLYEICHSIHIVPLYKSEDWGSEESLGWPETSERRSQRLSLELSAFRVDCFRFSSLLLCLVIFFLWAKPCSLPGELGKDWLANP